MISVEEEDEEKVNGEGGVGDPRETIAAFGHKAAPAALTCGKSSHCASASSKWSTNESLD